MNREAAKRYLENVESFLRRPLKEGEINCFRDMIEQGDHVEACSKLR